MGGGGTLCPQGSGTQKKPRRNRVNSGDGIILGYVMIAG